MGTILLIVVLLAALAAAFFAFVHYRRGSAREEFGPEFERVARERGSKKEAERELRARRDQVENQIRPLSDEGRRRYKEEWEMVERTFVDNPVLALDQANRVVTDILTERNFPTESRQKAADAVGVIHSKVVEDFRDAQRIHADTARLGKERSVEDESMEEMRRGIQKYRSVYERLV